MSQLKCSLPYSNVDMSQLKCSFSENEDLSLDICTFWGWKVGMSQLKCWFCCLNVDMSQLKCSVSGRTPVNMIKVGDCFEWSELETFHGMPWVFSGAPRRKPSSSRSLSGSWKSSRTPVNMIKVGECFEDLELQAQTIRNSPQLWSYWRVFGQKLSIWA